MRNNAQLGVVEYVGHVLVQPFCFVASGEDKIFEVLLLELRDLILLLLNPFR